MKNNTLKLFGIIAIMTVIGLSMAACGGENPPTDFRYEMNKNGNGIIILDYIGKNGGKIVIPAKIEGYPVVQIIDDTWVDGKWENVKGKGFQEYSESEMERRLKENPNNKTITNTNKDRVARITSVVIPDTVTYIGGQAFHGCVNLKQINLPKSLKVIGDSAFSNTGLTSIVIPEGVTQIGEFNGYTFYRCKKLTSVTLPESLEEIHPRVFEDCNELNTIKLPSHIIKYVFSGDRDFFKPGRDGELVRQQGKFAGNTILVLINPERNKAFSNCPKLSLAAREALKASGYTGEF